MKFNFSKLIPSLLLPIVVGASSGFLTFDNIDNWYINLTKPPLTPPTWVFGPVWFVIYLLIGLSLYLFWDNRKKINKKPGYLIYIFSLVSNFLWAFLFFGIKSPYFAFVDIIILIALIIANMHYFRQVSKNSALLLLPYLLWVCFATYLNLGILFLN